MSNTDSDEPLNLALIKSLDKFRLSKFIGFDTTFVPLFFNKAIISDFTDWSWTFEE